MARHDQEQPLLDALGNPLRRSLLRRLVESGERDSPRELARSEEQPLSSVSFHLRKLAELGAIETAGDLQIGSYVTQFYRASAWVRESPEVLTALGLQEG
jgi:DNA-binding transcriptional ArsR family regulator